MERDVTDEHRRRGDRRRGAIEFAMLVAIFFVAGGAPAPHVNETHYLAKARNYWDPSYCPGDLFFDSADAHLTFSWTVGWLTTWMSLPAAAWTGRIAAWLLLAAAWMRLMRQIAPVPWAAPAAGLVGIVLVDVGDFAGEWVVGGLHGRGGVEGKNFAYAFVLLGLAAMSAGRWTAPWIYFGLAAAWHALVGAWAVLAGLGTWLTEPRASRRRAATLLTGLAAGGALALPGLLPSLALDWGAEPQTRRAAAAIYVYERLPHHLAPNTLPTDELLRRSVRFALVVAAMVALAVWLARREDRDDDCFSPQGVRRVLRFATFAVAGNCLGLAIAMAPLERTTAALALRYYWFRQADIVVPLAVALGATAWAFDARRRGWPRPQLMFALALAACGGHLLRIAVDRVQNLAPPGAARMANVPAWIDVCTWVRDNAPPGAICLVPRQAQSFKWFAERADVVNWKDIPQDAASVVQWRERLHDVFPTVDGPEGPQVLASPERWSAARVREIARRYGATLVVVRSEPMLPLRELYSAGIDAPRGGYAVYEVGGLTDEAP